MPTTLRKNLNFCFTKIKLPVSSQSCSSWLTPNDNNRPLPSSSSATASSLVVKNYNSLCDNTFDSCTSKSLTHSSSLSTYPDSDSESDSEPDFAAVFASQRFFFTSPGSSNSIIESTPFSTPDSSSDTIPSTSSNTPINTAINDGCDIQTHQEHSHHPTTVKDSVAVLTISPNPYMDFRKSMQDMVEARDLIDVKANWDFLHELLLCYLALNPKNTHKFIVGAFADLLFTLMAEEGTRKPETAETTAEISLKLPTAG